jgi:NAD(P)-dependent dehydrogenase (short-subunit alcohol dehydrogenase family)
MTDFRLDGKTAIVTGAGRGIGKAVSIALAKAGAAITIVSRTTHEIQQVAAEITAANGKAQAFALDVCDIDRVRDFVRQSGPFNILVNNAGMNKPDETVSVTPKDYDAIMGLNVRAPYFMAQSVATGLINANQPGTIINMSSQMAFVGSAGRSVYCASKHAMEGFTKAMAVEWGQHGIRVNTVCPTFIETPMTKPFLRDKKFQEKVLSKIHLGRLGQVDDVTGAVVFLASDASRMITGSAIKVDGGWTAE